MNKLFSILFLFIGMASSLFAAEITKVEPANWWVGMNDTKVELLVYGKDLCGASVELEADDVQLLSVENGNSPDYLFVTLDIGKNQRPGNIELRFKKGYFSKKLSYELKARNENSAMRKGFDNSDVLYLIMPDRFANGDKSNDTTSGTIEAADRNNPNGRHGGDIAGIISKLDYLQQLGVTTIWPTPLWESNHVKTHIMVTHVPIFTTLMLVMVIMNSIVS